ARGVRRGRSRPRAAARSQPRQQRPDARCGPGADRCDALERPLDALARRRAAHVRGIHMIQTSLHPLDILIIVLYLAMLASFGFYFSRRQKSLDEYFLAKQSMAWLPVGLSLMAALDSAIDYLMQPSATIKYGLFLLIGTSSWFFLYPWVSK